MRKHIALLMLAGIITTACGQANTEETGLTWHTEFETASAEAEEGDMLMLIDMYADWCGPCRTLGEDFFPSEEMRPVLEQFALLKLDIDTEVGGAYAQTYGVSSIPCVVIARPDGTELGRIVGTTNTVEEYVQAVEEVLANI